MGELTYTEKFQYSHDNPYHDRLENFAEFVFRDEEAEKFQGKWCKTVFKRDAPLALEIGSGYGHFMMDYCEKNPDINFIGLDYRFKRSFQLAKKLDRLEKINFRYLRARGERIEFLFAENELDKIFYFFPDPWPKQRHQKKRLFKEQFLNAAYKVLKPGGKIFIKTDHDHYAEQMREEIKKSKLFKLKLHSTDLRNEFPEHFLNENSTKFEKIFLSQGVKIKGFIIESCKEGQCL